MDAERVAVSINSIGFIPIAIETEASIGKIICVVAVLDVSSVRKLIVAATIIIIIK